MNALQPILAIDVVLKVPEPLYSLCCSFSRKYTDARISLGDHMQPHVSLYMMAAAKNDLEKIKKILASIFTGDAGITLPVLGFTQKNLNSNKPVLHYELLPTAELQILQKQIVTALSPFYQNQLNSSSFVRNNDTEIITDSTLEWVKNFNTASTGQNFQPHITIGYGELPAELLNRQNEAEITFTELNVYQLGNHCTCRKKL